MRVQHATEADLVERLKRDDRVAFELLYARYQRRVYYSLLKLVRVDDIAQELQQDVFLKIWQYRSKLDPARPFEAILVSTARKLAINLYRRAAKEKSIMAQLSATMTELDDALNEQLDHASNRELLETAIEKLPPQRREVFRLVKLQEKSHQEVADLMGVSINTVRDHLAKASKFLKAELLTQKPELFMYVLLFIGSSKIH